MKCENCERLRKKLSPLEDPEFTAAYLHAQPTEWLRNECPRINYGGEEHIAVSLTELWDRINPTDAPPSSFDLAKLGRTLLALGWVRTKRTGELYFVMTPKEFDYVHPCHSVS